MFQSSRISFTSSCSLSRSNASTPFAAGTASCPGISRICWMTLRMIAESSTTSTFISGFLQPVIRGPAMADGVEVVVVELEGLGRARRERAFTAHHLGRLGQDVPLPGRGEVDQH